MPILNTIRINKTLEFAAVRSYYQQNMEDGNCFYKQEWEYPAYLRLYIDSPLDMYADDSTTHVTGKTIEELESKLNIDLKNVQIWCQKNRMAVNAEKHK